MDKKLYINYIKNLQSIYNRWVIGEELTEKEEKIISEYFSLTDLEPNNLLLQNNTLELTPLDIADFLTNNINNMRHVLKAWNKFPLDKEVGGKTTKFFIEIDNAEDVKGVAPVVKFTVQSDPIGEVGVNGLQATDMLEYVKYLFESLNEAYHSDFNDQTINAINIALHFQELRTKDRELRKVEGTNQK